MTEMDIGRVARPGLALRRATALLSVSVAVALAVAGAGPARAASGAPARASTAACPATVPDEATASATAARCHSRVEVTNSRTDRAQVFAEPSGAMTLEEAAVPVRVRRADGSWTPIDTTLSRRPDGALAPAATAAGVRFSGGGTMPLVSLRQAGRTWTMSWPTPLPAPVLSGDTATYREVLPGVDLAVQATVDGFTHVLVVKTPQAAANPAVREIHYRIGGGRPALRDGGQVVVTAADGTVLASADGADMWESSATTAGPQRQDPAASQAQSAGAGAAGMRPDGSGDVGRRAPMAVRAAGDDLVLTPDRSLLNDPAAHFPIFLDPEFTSGAARWAYADNTNVNDSDGLAWVGRDPDHLNLYRSFFDFDLSLLQGKDVTAAALEATLYHSWSCAASPIYAYRTVNVASTPRATWNNMPLIQYLDGQNAHAHKGTTSCGNQPDVVMWFGGNLTGDVHWAAVDNWSIYTVGFCACSNTVGAGESTTERWKKIYPSTVKLHATYNTPPDTVTALSTTPATACVTGPSRPAINTWTPLLSAVLTDPDQGAVLQADFHFSTDGGASWTALPRTGPQASGLTHTVPLPDVSAGAPAYITWRVLAVDGQDSSRSWSQTCEFTVDNQPPVSPVLQAGSVLPPYPLPAPAAVVVGTPVSVPIGPGASTDVVGYWYTVDTSVISPPRQLYGPATGGAALLQVTPVVSGVSANWLTVQSVDRAGNFSPETTYSFRANPAALQQHRAG